MIFHRRPKPPKEAGTQQGWQAYENQNQLRAHLLQDGPLSPYQQDLFLQVGQSIFRSFISVPAYEVLHFARPLMQPTVQ